MPPTGTAAVAAKTIVFPLALAQFVASYAGSNMNVAITTIANDIGTDVQGVQTAITLFTLTMASLMIPGSKLTDIFGRKRCFVVGLIVYASGAFIASLAQGLGLLIFGYSLLEGVGSALMIPPIYILITVLFHDMGARAKYFGAVSGAAGLGAAAGPLIGGLVTSAISWRASFILQVLLVFWVLILSRKIVDPPLEGPRPHFDLGGAILSAAGLFFIVLGILQSSTYGWGASLEDFTIGDTVIIPKGGISPVWVLVTIGAIILAVFFMRARTMEKHDKKPLIPTRMFHNRTSNLGLTTQLSQWLTLQGSFFVISVFLQDIRGLNAVKTGLVLTPATIGILLAAAAAGRMARRRSQRWLIQIGFVATAAGLLLLLALVRTDTGLATFVPGLLVIGLGIGVMLTSSVNVVQSSFPESDQGEISGLSRSVSNLGSSLGTALAGSLLVAPAIPDDKSFAFAIVSMIVFTLLGLLAALFLPAPARKPATT